MSETWEAFVKNELVRTLKASKDRLHHLEIEAHNSALNLKNCKSHIAKLEDAIRSFPTGHTVNK